jgi:NADH dehydrogenase (ubiquinone) 1 alpha subcomplex subunit 5
MLIASCLRLSRPHRVSTGITGLAVHPAPLPHLLQTYKSTLSIVSQLPAESVYRQATEALLNQRTQIISAAKEDVKKVEKELDEGMIEQVIEMADDELKLAGKMLEWQA